MGPLTGVLQHSYEIAHIVLVFRWRYVGMNLSPCPGTACTYMFHVCRFTLHNCTHECSQQVMLNFSPPLHLHKRELDGSLSG